jgi:hypothetical protein
VPDIVRIDANVFRLRLYREDCAAVFDQHLDLLHRLFCFHRAKERKQRLTMPGWLQLCTSVGWIGGDGGGPMSLYDAKVCFLWAQMQVSDEVKHRNKCISLAFVDFLEVRRSCRVPICADRHHATQPPLTLQRWRSCTLLHLGAYRCTCSSSVTSRGFMCDDSRRKNDSQRLSH